MEINLEDYLNEDEIRSIITNEITSCVRWKVQNMSDGHLTDIMTNLAYKVVDEIVEERFKNNLTQILADKVSTIIDSMSFYSIFRQKTTYGEASLGQKHLDEAVEANKDLINHKVVNLINDYDINDTIRESIEDAIYDTIHDKLFGKAVKEESSNESF